MGFWGDTDSGSRWTTCKQSAPCSGQITTRTPHHSFLQAGCSTWRPTNSVKALKALFETEHHHRKCVTYYWDYWEANRWAKQTYKVRDSRIAEELAFTLLHYSKHDHKVIPRTPERRQAVAILAAYAIYVAYPLQTRKRGGNGVKLEETKGDAEWDKVEGEEKEQRKRIGKKQDRKGKGRGTRTRRNDEGREAYQRNPINDTYTCYIWHRVHLSQSLLLKNLAAAAAASW